MTKVFEGKEGFRVELAAEPKQFVRCFPQGGGFAMRIPLEQFLANFKEVSGPPKYRAAAFSIDGGPKYTGYHTGSRWNGWAMPCFTMEQVEAQAEAQGELEYDKATDTWKATFDGADPESDFWEGGDIEVDGGAIHVYAIGAGGWCWDVTENKVSQLSVACGKTQLDGEAEAGTGV